MNLHAEIREAKAIAAGLREAAAVCGPSQNVLRARLAVAAEKVEQLASLATRAVERIEALEQELAGAIAGRDEAIRQLGVVREYEEASRQGGGQ